MGLLERKVWEGWDFHCQCNREVEEGWVMKAMVMPLNRESRNNVHPTRRGIGLWLPPHSFTGVQCCWGRAASVTLQGPGRGYVSPSSTASWSCHAFVLQHHCEVHQSHLIPHNLATLSESA